MTWRAVVRSSDGELLSTGSEVTDDLPPGTEVVDLPGEPDFATQRWDEATRTFVPRLPDPVVDRLQDLVGHPYLADVFTRLTVTQRQKLRRVFVWLLGSRRYRTPGEEVSIESPEDFPTDPGQVVE